MTQLLRLALFSSFMFLSLTANGHVANKGSLARETKTETSSLESPKPHDHLSEPVVVIESGATLQESSSEVDDLYQLPVVGPLIELLEALGRRGRSAAFSVLRLMWWALVGTSVTIKVVEAVIICLCWKRETTPAAARFYIMLERLDGCWIILMLVAQCLVIPFDKEMNLFRCLLRVKRLEILKHPTERLPNLFELRLSQVDRIEGHRWKLVFTLAELGLPVEAFVVQLAWDCLKDFFMTVSYFLWKFGLRLLILLLFTVSFLFISLVSGLFRAFQGFLLCLRFAFDNWLRRQAQLRPLTAMEVGERWRKVSRTVTRMYHAFQVFQIKDGTIS